MEQIKCIFCNKEVTSNRMLENDLAFAMFDKFPTSPGHMLVIPKRHFTTFFDATAEEYTAVCALILSVKTLLDEKYKPDGYNIVMNCGQAAGQSVMHCHVHVIPRYFGKAMEKCSCGAH